jgi:hypothetical protein
MNRIQKAVIIVILFVMMCAGCSQFPNQGNQDSNTSENEALSPLSLDDNDTSTKSYMNAKIDGKTSKYQLTSLLDGNEYLAIFQLRDKKGNALATISITIPANAAAGDVYRYDDEMDFIYGKGSVTFIDGRSQKSYMALNQYLTSGDPSEPLDIYSAGGNGDPFSFSTRAGGNKYAIAIDDVSSDGNLITGRFTAEFAHSENGSDDGFTIDESKFAINLTEISH